MMGFPPTLLVGFGAIAGVSAGWLIFGRPWLHPSHSKRREAYLDRQTEAEVNGAIVSDLSRQVQDAQIVLKQAPIGYVQVDAENHLMWCNKPACQVLGIKDPNYMPESPRLLLEVVRSYELDQLIEKTRRRQVPCEKDWVLNLVKPDPINPSEGKALPLRGYAIPLAEGQVGVFLENRQESITLMQQRDRWISDVAHELKTPLTSVRLVAETLRSRVDESLQSWVDRLLNEILRLSNLVEDLLNLSRLQDGPGNGLIIQPTDVPQLVIAAWQSLEPLAQIKHLELVYDGPKELVAAMDAALIHRVLINLMDNAIKYSPDRAVVMVRASSQTAPPDLATTDEPWLCVEVIDQGSGFKESDLPHIFSRFYRADPSRTRLAAARSGQGPTPTELTQTGGTGLGLAIVQQIVEAHGGGVTARNYPDTGGGWLTLWLPLSGKGEAMPALR